MRVHGAKSRATFVRHLLTLIDVISIVEKTVATNAESYVTLSRESNALALTFSVLVYLALCRYIFFSFFKFVLSCNP